MIVLDIETSGTDPEIHSILSIGAIRLTKTRERFYEVCRAWDGAHIAPEALAVNGFTEQEAKDPQKPTEADIVLRFMKWLDTEGDYVILGHNPSFDLSFLRAAARRAGLNITLPYRSVDLHSVVFADIAKRNIDLPIKDGKSTITSDFCMEYVGMPAEPKPHTAQNGALYEAESFARLLFKMTIFPEFSEYPLVL